ncbi:tRNA (N(6)-L-threonylcarbamoyladenosine(37)-C(2))-methylthiotransferase MtaB [Patescibacteria group bacterium]
MNIVIKTLGCKANRYESNKIQDAFEGKHLVIDAGSGQLKHADLIVVNTCTVTHVADRKSRQAISHFKKLYPDAKVIVFGCGSNVNPEGYKKHPNVNYVVKETDELIKLVEKLAKDHKAPCDHSLMPQNRTRTLIKIQDGCNNFCSYCIVPFARGREKSKPVYEIIEEATQKVSKRFKEIVLTGINIGTYNDNNHDLAELIEKILNDTQIKRLRLSSIEPQNFSNKFLKLLEDPRFCPHLHISLQSGCDEILKNMRRRYDTKMFKQMIESLRKAVPHISITTDLIIGFPGETEGHFIETVNFIKKIKFSKIHIFPYSKRKGTLAADMPEQISDNIKKERCTFLSALEKQMRMDFYHKNIGRSDSVLIEKIDKNGNAIGFTSNYLKTRTPTGIQNNANEIIHLRLDKVTDEIEMIGSLKT